MGGEFRRPKSPNAAAERRGIAVVLWPWLVVNGNVWNQGVCENAWMREWGKLWEWWVHFGRVWGVFVVGFCWQIISREVVCFSWSSGKLGPTRDQLVYFGYSWLIASDMMIIGYREVNQKFQNCPTSIHMTRFLHTTSQNLSLFLFYVHMKF